MAAAHVAIVASDQSTTSGTGLSCALFSGVSAGNTILVWIGMLNTDSTHPTVSSLTKPGGETASWALIASHDSTSATAGAGVRGELWGITTTVAWASAFSLAATLSAAVVARAMTGESFSGVSVPSARTAGNGTSTAGTPSATAANPLSGDLVVGCATWQWNSSTTEDADSSNGTWSAASTAAAIGGGASTSVKTYLQYKVTTGDGSQTYNPTASSSVPSGAIVVAVPVPTAGTTVTLPTATATATAVDATVTTTTPTIVTLPTATATATAIDATVYVAGTVVTLPTATATATAIDLTVVVSFTAWTADDTQQANIEVIGVGVLTVQVPVAAVPAGVTPTTVVGRHVVMATPTLDADMRPINWEPTYA